MKSKIFLFLLHLINLVRKQSLFINRLFGCYEYGILIKKKFN